MTSSPWSKPASTSPSLGTKPESGGTPPSASAGTRNSTAMTGAERTRLPRRLSCDEPPTCSISPPVRNSVVIATMWCIV